MPSAFEIKYLHFPYIKYTRIGNTGIHTLVAEKRMQVACCCTKLMADSRARENCDKTFKRTSFLLLGRVPGALAK